VPTPNLAGAARGNMRELKLFLGWLLFALGIMIAGTIVEVNLRSPHTYVLEPDRESFAHEICAKKYQSGYYYLAVKEFSCV
jgi:hypothetical protein